MNLNDVLNQMEQLSHSQVASTLGVSAPEPTPEQLALWANFTAHCQRRGVQRNFPASPALVADFLNTLPDEALEAACQALVAIHDSVGASNPVASLAVRTVLERRLRTEAPRSWSREDKQLWASLPIETRQVLTRRENERDASLRTKQNKLAAEIKRASADAEPKKEVENEQS